MKFKFSLLFLAFLSFTILASAQSIENIDFENINVDNLTEQQIQRLNDAAKDRGLSANQLAQLAVQRGMPRSEAVKLRNRLNQAGGSGRNNSSSGNNRLRYTELDISDTQFFDGFFGADSTRDSLHFYQSIELVKYQTKQDSIALVKQKLKDKIFGYSLFNNSATSFEPSLNIPTPANYQLGAGDELIIDIYGSTEDNYQLQVSPDGMVVINNIGPIYINGLTIEEAKTRLKSRLGEIYSGLNPSQESEKNTYMQLSLGQVRSIKVTVIGEANKPGTYTVSSLATVFNALYSAGGPTVTGSFRNIDIIRGDSVISNFDLYNLLIDGNQSKNIRLRDQDIIKINPYVNRVQINGEVKRPGIYETRNAETLEELIKFAGRFTGNAYQDRIKIIGSTDRQRRINDVAKGDFDEFNLHNGDLVNVEKVLDRFENIVEIRGAVFREGRYEVTDTTTLHSLIKRAEGLRGDAFQNRGLIYREQDDYTLETLRFGVKELMQNPDENDIALRKNDLVIISSIFDLRDEYFVQIQGAVQSPDKYKFADGMTLEDIIFQANGFTNEATPYRIEVARRLQSEQEDFNTSQIADIFRFNVNKNLSMKPGTAAFELEPFDKVYIRKAPNYQKQQDVIISGQVEYPGSYSLETENDRVSDIINRAGGLTNDAYTEGATLFREVPGLKTDKNEDTEDIEGFFTQRRDSLNQRNQKPNEVTISKIGLQLPRILENPESKFDFFVQKQDSIFVPKQLQTVIVKGGVFYPTSIRYDDDLTYRDYITAAGGYNELAKNKNSYIVYANGDVNRVKRFLFFKDYPSVKPGATLVVPEEEAVKSLSAQERVAIYSAIVSTIAVVSTTIFQITR